MQIDAFEQYYSESHASNNIIIMANSFSSEVELNFPMFFTVPYSEVMRHAYM